MAGQQENWESMEKILVEQKSGPLPLREGEWGSAEIRAALGVASRTVVKYMSELEKEGKVAQIGNTGRGVVYKESD